VTATKTEGASVDQNRQTDLLRGLRDRFRALEHFFFGTAPFVSGIREVGIFRVVMDVERSEFLDCRQIAFVKLVERAGKNNPSLV
jgi:hypothetical protein